MPPGERRDLIDRSMYREVAATMRARIAEEPKLAKITQRARIRLIENQLKEARVGEYTILCDEARERRGGGLAPSPLQYLVAAVGF